MHIALISDSAQTSLCHIRLNRNNRNKSSKNGGIRTNARFFIFQKNCQNSSADRMFEYKNWHSFYYSARVSNSFRCYMWAQWCIDSHHRVIFALKYNVKYTFKLKLFTSTNNNIHIHCNYLKITSCNEIWSLSCLSHCASSIRIYSNRMMSLRIQQKRIHIKYNERCSSRCIVLG